ncbi:hypothetical protein QC760_010556 [Botrytis cinerea]
MTMVCQPAPTTGNVQILGLLRLPLELQNQIYHYLIPVKRIIEVSRPCFKYTISNKAALGLDIADVVSDYYDSRLEQDEQALPDIGTLDNNLSISETKGGDPESGLQKDTHMKDVADFGGCTNSAYEIDWDQVTTSWGTDRKKNSIFLVCKQIPKEALDVMYGENAFRYYLHAEGDRCLKTNFTDANRGRMRMLLLIAEHRSWIGEITPDIAMWSSIIPTLKILRLVAEQPIQKKYWDAPPLEKEMESWFMFMRAFLNCFHHSSEGRSPEVDFNGKTETGEVVKECMLDGYREVRCGLSGDLMFRRGPFSYNSGYWDDDDQGFGSWDA